MSRNLYEISTDGITSLVDDIIQEVRDECESEVQELKDELAELRSERDDLAEQVGELENELEDLKAWQATHLRGNG